LPETPRFYVWPAADERTMTLAMLALVALFASAVLLELYRRRRDRALRLKAEWRGVRELCQDREMADEDWNLLRAILAQYAPRAPYAAVTRRRTFDECIQRYFEALWATAPDWEVFERGLQLRDVRTQLGLDYVPLGQRIHSTRELYCGQSVWAALAHGHEPDWRHYTVAAVDEARFSLELIGAEVLPEIAAGDVLKFRFWREDDARYVFDAPVLAPVAKPPGWTIAHVESLTRNQARAHFRIPHDQVVTVGILNAPLGEEYGDLDARPPVTDVRGRITSLSAGGLAVAFQQPVPKQVLLRVPVALPDAGEPMVIYVRPVGTRNLSGGRSLLRGRFVALDDERREAIARYVILKQKHSVPDAGS